MPLFEWPLVASVLVKLGMAALLGAIVGYERELHGRPAGIRTHMMLIIGVTLFSEVSKHFGGPDEGRIAAQIVTGVGFLGAGTILRLGAEIKGLTTAASLWTVSAIGMAVSAGGSFLVIAGAATLLAVFTLAVVDSIEARLVPAAHPRALDVTLTESGALESVLARIEAVGGYPIGVRVQDSSRKHVTLSVQGPHSAILNATLASPEVSEANWTA